MVGGESVNYFAENKAEGGELMANGKVGRPAGVRRKALTAREQKFAQVYARTCNKSAAFREAYSCGNMNATQIA